MRRLIRLSRRGRCQAAPEDGFTLIEVMFAAAITVIGLLATILTFDTSRDLVSVSERKEAAVHRGEREIERILALRYEDVALQSLPASSGDPLDPAYYVSGSTYRWNQSPGAPPPTTEPLVTDPDGAIDPVPRAWTDGRLSGRIQTFVTWVNDPVCAEALCGGTADYKRVTVAVTVEGPTGPDKPILLSSFVADPDAKPAGSVLDGTQNPLTSPSTTCLSSSGARVECSKGFSGIAKTWFLYDTPAPDGVRQPIEGDHRTHPTVAPSGPCGADGTGGCPVPDLMGDAPPPAPDPLPPLFRYSSEQAATDYAGGRVLRLDVSCEETRSPDDNAKGELWVTAPLPEPTTLTGDGGLSLHTKAIGAEPAQVTLCTAFYDVPASLGNLVKSPPTEIGRAGYGLDRWPASPSIVAFLFDFRGALAPVTVPADHRIGMRIWVAGASGDDIAVLYDHPSHPSSVQLNAAL